MYTHLCLHEEVAHGFQTENGMKVTKPGYRVLLRVRVFSNKWNKCMPKKEQHEEENRDESNTFYFNVIYTTNRRWPSRLILSVVQTPT